MESTQLTLRSVSNFKIPDCRHGNPINTCELCARERAARQTKDQEAEQTRREELKKVRAEHPERWMGGIPRRYLNYAFDNFTGGDMVKKICRNFVAEYPNVDSLLFSGPPGCGKTHLAMATCRALIAEMKVNNRGEHDDDGRRDISFTTVPELLLEIRRTFGQTAVESEDDVINKYAQVNLLILDDLGAEKASEFAIQALYLLIDRRNRDLKPTIITTNLTLSEIENRLNGRIASRLAEMTVVKINMPDHRKMRTGKG
jgi:DNA replication protein DnaC